MEADPLWDLLRKDAQAHPISPSQAYSPWFAARTTALIHKQVPATGFFRRWMIPIPFAALGAVVLTLHFAAPLTKPNAFISSEEEFEQHIELLASSE